MRMMIINALIREYFRGFCTMWDMEFNEILMKFCLIPLDEERTVKCFSNLTLTKKVKAS